MHKQRFINMGSVEREGGITRFDSLKIPDLRSDNIKMQKIEGK